MAHWLLQCNPAKWRIHDFLAAGNEITSWSVGRYLTVPRAGDDVALWITGDSGGVVALGVVDGPPEKVGADSGDADYWTSPRAAQSLEWQLPVHFARYFLDTPIHRDILRSDARFIDAAIFREPRSSNPFLLSDREWEAVKNHAGDDLASRSRGANWDLKPGETIARTLLHEKYGGSTQGGVSQSRSSPNVLLFTDPSVGNRHGYYDEWAPDGTFLYTGHGQEGDQRFISGNKAIRDYLQDGRAIRLFEGSREVVKYVGEFALDPAIPYVLETTHSTAGGPSRRVIRFRLRPLLEEVPIPGPSSPPGSPYREQDEEALVALPAASAPLDPDSAGRGLRSHRRLQNALANCVRSRGLTPWSPVVGGPNYDLAWSTPDGAVVVVEVKSILANNEIRQLRLGLGQILDYRDALERTGHRVRSVLYVEREPGAVRWPALAEKVGVVMSWPGAEDRIFLTDDLD